MNEARDLDEMPNFVISTSHGFARYFRASVLSKFSPFLLVLVEVRRYSAVVKKDLPACSKLPLIYSSGFSRDRTNTCDGFERLKLQLG